MEHKTATMIGAVAALATAPAIAAAPAGPAITMEAPAIPAAQSYAELLEPIPNAVERLKRAEAESAARRLTKVQLTIDIGPHHHHHHHHHHHSRAWYLAHGYFWSGGAWILRPVHHHHHHHHHHHDE
jgi:hypothetical protein